MTNSDPTSPVSTNIHETMEDFRRIIEEISDFTARPVNEQMRILKAEAADITRIPLPNGHIPLRPSSSAFGRITNRLVNEQPNHVDFSVTAVEHHLRTTFGDVFGTHRAELTREAAEAVLQDAITSARAEHRQITHHLPCIAFATSTPDHFMIGPVHFRTTERFLREYQTMIEQTREEERAALIQHWQVAQAQGRHTVYKTQAEASAMADTITDQTKDFYTEHGWVATLTVPPCHPEISRERAEQAIQAGLDVLKLIFGTRATGIRLATGRAIPTKTRRWIQASDHLEYELSIQGETIIGADNWHTLIGPLGRYYLRAAGITITAYAAPARSCRVGQRFLDALHWYGEAISEPSLSAAIVKYAAALERLTITPEIRGSYTKTVATRAGLLAGAGDRTEYERTATLVRTLYDDRSAVMHGRRSPHESPRTTTPAAIVSRVLWRYLDLARTLMRKQQHTDEDLAREYQRLQATV